MILTKTQSSLQKEIVYYLFLFVQPLIFANEHNIAHH